MASKLLDILNHGSTKEKLSAIANVTVDDSFSDHRTVCEVLEQLPIFGFVPQIATKEEIDVSAEEFVGTAEKAATVFKCIHKILEKSSLEMSKDDLLSVFLFCSQHVRCSPWSTNESIKQSKGVLKFLLSRANVLDAENYLSGSEDVYFIKRLFSSFKLHLTASNWKCNPGMKCSFEWCLSHIRHPFGADLLQSILPPSLLFVDDYVVENRVIGIRCLNQILNITPAGDLQRNGYGELIHSALKNVIYQRNASVIDVVYPCILKVLSITQDNPQKPVTLRMVNQYDVLVQHILKEMNMEQTIILRQAFSSHLHLFIDIMGVTAVRHLKRMLNILLQYLEVYDGPEEITRLNCLLCLEKLINVAQPRIGNHLSSIVKGIVRLIYETSEQNLDENVAAEVRSRCITCLRLLDQFYSSQIDEMCHPLLTITERIPALHIIENIWTTNV